MRPKGYQGGEADQDVAGFGSFEGGEEGCAQEEKKKEGRDGGAGGVG